MAKIVVATAFGGPEVLSVIDADVPEPSHGEVRLAVRAIGVNPVDVKVRSGEFGADPETLPRRLGNEAAGVVTAVGDDAVGPNGPFAVEDEVIAYPAPGSYAEELVLPADAVVPKPEGLGWAEASGLLLTGVTAVHALTAANVGEGDTVLVHGAAGGVGQMVVQLAILRGARVIGTASASNHSLVRELGGEPVPYGDGLLDRVRDIAPDGIDAALDLVGSDEAMDVSLALVAERARIVTIASFERGGREGVQVLGSGPGGDPGTELRNAARTRLAELAGDGRLVVRVARTFPLDEVAAAQELQAAGHASGKVVLIP